MADPGTTASPSADLPPLDERDLDVLREVGRHWPAGDPRRRALPVDPGLRLDPKAIRPGRFGGFAAVPRTNGRPAEVEATEEAMSPSGAGFRLRRLVLGPPLRSTAIARERLRKLVALPVLSADALSSVAYGPEALLAVLVVAGSSGLSLSLPIAAAIVLLMITVGVSYRQTIRAYPNGGGSYIVASENLGRVPGLAAAGGLMTDYILTVAVSIAAGVAAVTSAVPAAGPAAVPIGLGVIALLLVGNLRGVRQAGAAFAAPTYAFIAAIGLLATVGLAHAATRGFHATAPPAAGTVQSLGLLLVLRAFASGSTAMTGIEAISNAVPAFRPPGWRNARTTLSWMTGILVLLYAATVVLAHLEGIVPRPDETVLSQLAHASFGHGPLYVFTQASTAAILLLAANTAFNDFPRVLYLLARDLHAPSTFLRLGDRLAFNNGIVILAVAAAAILVAFGASTDALIPLYAVGVFLAFTLSQTGMVVHWWRRRGARWRRSMAFNAAGAGASALVFLIAGATKFTEGAWVALIVVGAVVLAGLGVRRYYLAVGRTLALHPVDGAARADVLAPAEGEEIPDAVRHLLIVPVASIDLASLRALAYAASIAQPVLAVHIAPAEEEAQRFGRYWRAWGDHVPLEVVVSPYRAVIAPLIHYIKALHRQRPDLTITVVVPELRVARPWHRPLHSRTASRLRRALTPLPGIVVTEIPFHLPLKVTVRRVARPPIARGAADGLEVQRARGERRAVIGDIDVRP
jgi:amino acid transporter